MRTTGLYASRYDRFPKARTLLSIKRQGSRMTALHLLGLPLEVQRIIYQKLYENCLPLAPGYDGSRRSGGRSISLLLTSRHMYCEARPYYRQACTALDLTACDRDVAGDTVEKLGRHGKQQAQAWLREILCEVAVDACSFRRFDAICRLPSIKKLTIYASTCYYYARKKSTAEFLGDFDRAVPRRMLEEEEEPYLYTAYSALPGIKLVVLWVGRVTTYDARIQMVYAYEVKVADGQIRFESISETVQDADTGTIVTYDSLSVGSRHVEMRSG